LITVGGMTNTTVVNEGIMKTLDLGGEISTATGIKINVLSQSTVTDDEEDLETEVVEDLEMVETEETLTLEIEIEVGHLIIRNMKVGGEAEKGSQIVPGRIRIVPKRILLLRIGISKDLNLRRTIIEPVMVIDLRSFVKLIHHLTIRRNLMNLVN